MAGFEQGTADDATLAFGPLFPLWILLARIVDDFGRVTELRIHLPAVGKGRHLGSRSSTCSRHEVVALVTIKVTTESLHLVTNIHSYVNTQQCTADG